MLNNEHNQFQEKELELNHNNKETHTPYNNINIVNMIKDLSSKEIFLITNNFQKNIPLLLSFLMDNSNSILDKLLILKYIENIFTKVSYNSDLFSQKKSLKENMNLYEVIINQYIIIKKEGKESEEYLRELKDIFILLLSQITLDKNTYHYIFSFIIKYINKINNNENDNNNFNEEQLSRILFLLQIYYQSVQTIDEPYNYIFFWNDNIDTNIIINWEKNTNKKFFNKFFNYDENLLNIILFIKLIPEKIIKKLYKNIKYKILSVKFDNNNENKNISIGIDNNNYLITNFTNKEIIKLEENKTICLLFKLNLKEKTKSEIFIDNKKIELNKDVIIHEEKDKKTNDLKIRKIKFFQNYIGICSNIIIYKESNKDKNNGLPKFFINENDNNNIKHYLMNGIYKEELFYFLLNSELNGEIDENIINQMKFNNEKISDNELKEIKDFVSNNLISIYMPNRHVISENSKRNKITLKDSINNIDAELNITSSENEGLNNIHIFRRISEDFSHFGGLNHFLPIIEIMAKNNLLLKDENLSNFFNLISSVFMPSYKQAIKIENNANFFFNLSYFLEKIPDEYFDNQIALKLISISTSLIYYQNNYLNLIKQFHNDILLNKEIFFKFKYQEQYIILQQIKLLLDFNQKGGFNIDIMYLINILLTYDEEKHVKFCCKDHSQYFNEISDIYTPELSEIYRPFEEIISKLFELFIREASQCQGKECETGKKLFKIFEILSLDISPCLQKIIIRPFLNYMTNHFGKYFSFLDTNKRMLDIILFIFTTSVFDIKIDALNLILFMNTINESIDEFQSNRSRTNSWAYNLETTKIIDFEKSIYIQNNILPYYLLGEGILVSSSSKNNNENEPLNEDKIAKKKKTNIGLKKGKKVKKNNNFYKINEDEVSKSMTFTGNESLKELTLKPKDASFNYIKVTPVQQKIYLNYKRKKINIMIFELYNNTLKSYKESPQCNFVLNLLIKIVSKSDIILISKFLKDLEKKSEKKKLLENMNQSIYLFHWLLETSFQAFMIKESNFDKDKFKPGFNIEPLNNDSPEKIKILKEEEKKSKIEEIYSMTTKFIIDIINNNIYNNLDYLFTWSKYYYELRSDKNNFQKVRNFLYKILRSLFKSTNQITILDKDIPNQNKYLYYLNILFEFLTFYKVSAKQGDNIKDTEQITEELFTNFPYILLLELEQNKEKNNKDDNGTNLMLNLKWTDYPFYQKIYSFFKMLWIPLSDKKKNYERDNITILKKSIGKKNIYLKELEILFHSYENNNIEEIENANKGIKSVIYIFHFFILLFGVVEEETEINNLYTDFYLFICLLIISSSNLTISENRKQKWPNEYQYKEVQDIVELILCYTLKYYKDKILDIDKIIKKYKEENNENKIKFYQLFHNILIESLFNIIKLLGLIYSENKSKFLAKFNLMTKPGPFILLENIYSYLEPKDNNLNIEKEENFINNILKYNIKRDSKISNLSFEKDIYLFINNAPIQQFISNILKNKENIKKLFPFEDIIRKREEKIQNIIPIYNNELNCDKSQTNLYLLPDYWQECSYNEKLKYKIEKINNEFIKEIFLIKKSINIQNNQKIQEYKIIKKKLFSFKGIWSNEEYFYNPKYHLKYKIVNHYTQDFTKILITPIFDLDYYLPSFSDFQIENLFRVPDNNKIPVYHLVDLSFALLKNPQNIYHNNNNKEISNNKIDVDNIKEVTEKIIIDEKEAIKEDKIITENNGPNAIKSMTNENNVANNKDITIKNRNDNDIDNKDNNIDNLNNNTTKIKYSKNNALFDIKQSYYNFDLLSKEETSTDSTLFSQYISKKHLISPTKYDSKFDSCLIKTELHICGIFYNNSKEIGFYSSDRIPSNNEEYDTLRQVCFGSIYKPQMNKYNYYYICIPYNEINFILKKKYYFKKTGLEIYTINNKSYFFKFDEDSIKTVYENIKHYMKNDIEEIYIEYTKFDEKIGFFNKKKCINNIPIISSIKNMNLKYIYEKWTKWEISTLRLLMYINIYSNRSFNDINQYPVFPWILIDYSSKNLPKEIPLRQLGTPMGMLDFNDEVKERKDGYISTWNMSTDENIEEADRYRSHYSTSLYITYYLVRVFPFSSMRVELQGKNFDDPHRLFNSLKDSFWCATTQRADVRELIPEFFFFPEMFYNYNELNLGEIKDKKTKNIYKVNHIKMPEWSNDDAYIFINKHRTILESPEVSEKINEWFNIIFGSRQRGKEAKKIGNLFLKSTYDEEFEEEVYNQSDIKMKNYYCRMVEFGVTPHQIFKYDTPKRLTYSELKMKKNIFFKNLTEFLKKSEDKTLEIINEINLNEFSKNSHFHPIKIFCNKKDEDDNDKKKLFILDKYGKIKIFRLEQIQNMFFKKKLSQNTNSSNNLNALDIQNNNNNNNNSNEDKKYYKSSKKITQISNMNKEQKLFLPKYRLNSDECPSLFYNKGHNIVLGGFWNGNILIDDLLEETKKDKNKKVQSKIYITKESSPITHIIIDDNENFLICGNTFGTIYIYIIDSKDKNILHLYRILYDHFSPISSLAFDNNLNVFISCSKDGFCNLYSIPQFKIVNSFKIKNIINNNDIDENNKESSDIYSNATIISSSPLPCIIFYFRVRNSLMVCNINGHFIKEQKIDYEINPNNIKKFIDNQFIEYLLIMDQENEKIYIYNIIDLTIVMMGHIKNYNFIDVIFSPDFDNLFLLAKSKNENKEYKIIIIKNTKILMKPNNEEEPKIE